MDSCTENETKRAPEYKHKCGKRSNIVNNLFKKKIEEFKNKGNNKK